MSSAEVKKSVDPTFIGEYAAKQPLSGKTTVDETFAVSGLGRGGYARREEANKKAS